MVQRALVVVVVLLLVHSDATAGSPWRWYSPLLINPQCPTLCSIREVREAKIVVRTSFKPGTNGLVIDLRASGVVREGHSTPANDLPLRLRIGLSHSGRPCEEYASPPLQVQAGRLAVTITGRQLQPTWNDMIGIVTVCSVAIDHLGAPQQGAVLIPGLVLTGRRGFQ